MLPSAAAPSEVDGDSLNDLEVLLKWRPPGEVKLPFTTFFAKTTFRDLPSQQNQFPQVGDAKTGGANPGNVAGGIKSSAATAGVADGESSGVTISEIVPLSQNVDGAKEEQATCSLAKIKVRVPLNEPPLNFLAGAHEIQFFGVPRAEQPQQNQQEAHRSGTALSTGTGREGKQRPQAKNARSSAAGGGGGSVEKGAVGHSGGAGQSSKKKGVSAVVPFDSAVPLWEPIHFDLYELFSTTRSAFDVTVPSSAPFYGATVELVAAQRLLPAPLMSRLQPVLVCVKRLENVPSVLLSSPQGSDNKQKATSIVSARSTLPEETATAENRSFQMRTGECSGAERAQLTCGSFARAQVCYRFPDLPSISTGGKAPDAIANTLFLGVGGETAWVSVDCATVRFNARKVLLLGSRNYLSAFQRLFQFPIEFSVRMTASSATELEPDSALGICAVSCRSTLAESRPAHVNAALQVLPFRGEGSGASAAARYAMAQLLQCHTTLCVSVSFASAAPAPLLVSPPLSVATDASQSESFLTRAVVVIPFRHPRIRDILGALLKSIVSFRRARDATRRDGITRSDNVQESRANRPCSQLAAFHPLSTSQHELTKGTASVSPEEKSHTPSPQSSCDPCITFVTPDAISGFEVMDGETRIFCIEGPVAMVHAVVQAVACERDEGDDSVTILFNAEMFVPQRWYHEYPSLVRPLPTERVRPVSPPSAPPTSSGAGETRARAMEVKTGKGKLKGSPSTVRGKGSTSPPPSSAPTGKEEPNLGHVQDIHSEGDDATEDLNETVDGGGVGGRIHRTRIKPSLSELRSTQSLLLHRRLSTDCLQCILKLTTLQQCTTALQALQLNAFPTPHEITALERHYGQVLEFEDVHGHAQAPPTMAGKVESTQRPVLSNPEATERSSEDVDVTSLRESDVGKEVFFVATPTQHCRRPLPPDVLERHPLTQWMRVHAVDVDVLCIFRTKAPHGMVSFNVAAQVVRSCDRLLLYVLKCDRVSQGGTITHNPPYETLLRQRNEDLLQSLRNPRSVRGAATIADGPRPPPSHSGYFPAVRTSSGTKGARSMRGQKSGSNGVLGIAVQSRHASASTEAARRGRRMGDDDSDVDDTRVDSPPQNHHHVY